MALRYQPQFLPGRERRRRQNVRDRESAIDAQKKANLAGAIGPALGTAAGIAASFIPGIGPFAGPIVGAAGNAISNKVTGDLQGKANELSSRYEDTMDQRTAVTREAVNNMSKEAPSLGIDERGPMTAGGGPATQAAKQTSILPRGTGTYSEKPSRTVQDILGVDPLGEPEPSSVQDILGTDPLGEVQDGPDVDPGWSSSMTYSAGEPGMAQQGGEGEGDDEVEEIYYANTGPGPVANMGMLQPKKAGMDTSYMPGPPGAGAVDSYLGGGGSSLQLGGGGMAPRPGGAASPTSSNVEERLSALLAAREAAVNRRADLDKMTQASMLAGMGTQLGSAGANIFNAFAENQAVGGQFRELEDQKRKENAYRILAMMR